MHPIGSSKGGAKHHKGQYSKNSPLYTFKAGSRLFEYRTNSLQHSKSFLAVSSWRQEFSFDQPGYPIECCGWSMAVTDPGGVCTKIAWRGDRKCHIRRVHPQHWCEKHIRFSPSSQLAEGTTKKTKTKKKHFYSQLNSIEGNLDFLRLSAWLIEQRKPTGVKPPFEH